MWIWHTATKSVECALPSSTLEVLQIDGQLKVIAHGAVEELKISVNAPKSLGDLLICLDTWLEECAFYASGIIGSECRVLLGEELHWVTDSSLVSEHIKGESLIFVMQAGNVEEFFANKSTKNDVPQYVRKTQFVIDQQTVKEVNDLVSRGLEIRSKLDSDHLVISVPVPVNITASLIDTWLDSVQTRFPQGFLMKGYNWEIISCTPERFISIADSKVQVQILAGTFKEGTVFDKDSLMDEHQAARTALRSLVEEAIGELQLTVDCDLVEFGEIKHFHSVFEKSYQSDISMLWTLATLTPSPATGAQDKQTQLIIQELEGRFRGYYGGCFFLRTPGYLESLVSIRSIFHIENSKVGEMIVGAGFKKGSTLNSESMELLSKATSSANLLGLK